MLALIPARGGSKGVTNKNIKLLNGKPLIAYSIEAALASSGVSRVIVSTDSKEIAEISKKYGAEVPFMRPDNLASDDTKSIEVYKFVLNELFKREGVFYNELMILQPTSPLRQTEDIDNAISLYNTKNADSVISYCLEHHPIKWHKYITADGKFSNIFEDSISNRQEERPSFFPNGAIYIFKSDLIFKDLYYTENSYALIMERNKSVDIDTIEDFEYAEWIIKRKNREI